MAGWRIATGIGIVVVLAVAATFVVSRALRGEPEVVASEPAVAAPSATATPTSDPDPMPELHNTGEDFDRIYRSIEDFRNWLFRNPDPQLVERIYHPDCECFSELRTSLQTLIDDDVKFAQSDTKVHEVTILDQERDFVALKVVDEGVPQVVVNVRTGEVVDRGEGWERRAYRFLLVREGRIWRVRDILGASLDLEPDSWHESAVG